MNIWYNEIRRNFVYNYIKLFQSLYEDTEGCFLSIINTRGLVLTSFDLKENDKIVWIYTEELGKICVIARGARKKNSKLTSVIQSMCFVNFSIYKGKSAYFINEGIIIDSFQDLLRDFETIAYSSYICELMNLSIPENEKNNDVFVNAVKCLYLIKNSVGDTELLMRSFELKLIQSMGYSVNTDGCLECGSKIKKAFFSEQNYGFMCENCGGTGKFISTGAFMTLRALLNFKVENVHRISAGEGVKGEIKRITNSYLGGICSRRPKSLDMLKFL